MRAALVPLEATFGFTVEVVDIDLQGDAALLVKYDELVPLLAGRKRDGSELEICHYFLDLAALQAYFACDDRDG